MVLRLILIVFMSAALLLTPFSVSAQRCERVPEIRFGRPPPKIPGSNGFEINVIGNHTRYIPGKTYSIKLVGIHTKTYWQKFEGFFLVAESADDAGSLGPHRYDRVGRFQLFGEALTRFSDECPNMVTHTSSAPKTDISVMWVAPSPNSGCVLFRATVIEHPDAWYKDDETLTYKMCEKIQENQDHQPPTLSDCCACDEAKYEVIFQGLWSRHTHPKDFPRHEWDTAFSDVIGASHSSQYRFWQYGGQASEGVRQLAEWGDTKKLESELKDHSAHVRTIIKSRGLEHPNVQSRTFAVFRVDRRHHQASLISRIKPSPDWMVGVSAMELCLRNCSWSQRQVLNLRPWDVGTSNGDSYLSSSSPTVPPQRIKRITSKWPANSPFFDPNGAEIPPLARLIIQRQRVYERTCAGEPFSSRSSRPSNSGFGLSSSSFDAISSRVSDLNDRRTSCATTPWGPWSTCSTECGQGTRSRNREYVHSRSARSSGCSVTLTEYTPCQGTESCPSSWNSYSAPYTDNSLTDDMCALTEWSHWSACSSSCDHGTRSRLRQFKNRRGRKRCPQVTLESEPCVGPHEECDSSELVPPGCEVTMWSDWSPCSALCGTDGKQVRKRMYMAFDAASSGCNVALEQDRVCTADRRTCKRTHNGKTQTQLRETCIQPPEVGTCRNSFGRYHYSTVESRCVPFTYTGCGGNHNNFMTLQECMATCGSDMSSSHLPDSHYDRHNGGVERSRHGATASYGRAEPDVFGASQVVNPLLSLRSRSRRLSDWIPSGDDGCVLSDWSEWSSCSASCGSGRQWRQRRVVASPWSGRRRPDGRPCAADLTHYRDCHLGPCD